ncbi:hypothetical protein AURDEDRAFT_118637 [Auricularia subglabra TFB-10046 SS5]|nr:hypothetical protein AURDEDRAFT_118637 [Auricularia subglabra TFB-10046 SS5]
MTSSRRRGSTPSEDYDEDDITVDLDASRNAYGQRRRFSSSSDPDTGTIDGDGEDEDVRMSVMGPKLTLVSRAPWEPGAAGDLLAEDDEDDGASMLDTLSLFGGKTSARGRKLAAKDSAAPSPTTAGSGIDWRRPFAAPSSRSSSSTRPSREYRSQTNTVYSNAHGARSAASLSVYSVASARDLSLNAPPLPGSSSTGTTPPNSAGGAAKSQARPPKVRARTTSAGTSSGTRSSVFSAVSSHSYASDIPPMPRVPFSDSPSATTSSFSELESPLHPYANPDLLGDKDDNVLVRSESGITVTSSLHDDVALAPSLSTSSSNNAHGFPPRSPRGPKNPLSINAISTPLPAPPGALSQHNMSGWGAVPGSPSFNLISLEQAQMKVRDRTRSVYSNATSPSSPASGVFPPIPPPTRSRTTSVGAPDAYLPPEPPEPSPPTSAGPPAGKSVKTRRSGFLRLFKGAEKEAPPELPSMPPAAKPVPPPLPSSHQPQQTVRARAMTSDMSSPTRRAHPALSVVVTPSPQQAQRPAAKRVFPAPSSEHEHEPHEYLGGNSAPSLSASPASPLPPKSAPPTVTGFEDGKPALQLRPMSTLFNGLPENLFTPQASPQSPPSSDGQLSPAPELVAGWQRQIKDLEGQVRELRQQLAELKSGAPCEHCGRGGVTFGTGGADKTPPAPVQHSQSQDDWRAAGVSVLDRPRARTAGRERTTFQGMWREG